MIGSGNAVNETKEWRRWANHKGKESLGGDKWWRGRKRRWKAKEMKKKKVISGERWRDTKEKGGGGK